MKKPTETDISQLRDLLARARDVLEMIPPPLIDCYTNALQADIAAVLPPVEESRPAKETK